MGKIVDKIANKVTSEVSEILKKYYTSGPMSGGNLFDMRQELEAINAIWNKSSFGDRKMYKETYWEMLRQADYWANVFLPTNFNDLIFENKIAIKLLLNCLFMFGICAMYYNKAKGCLEPYLIYGPTKCDIYGTPYACKGIPAGLSFAYGALDYTQSKPYGYQINKGHENAKAIEDFAIELNPQNSVFFIWNDQKLGAWVLYIDLVNELLDAKERVQTVAKLTTLMYERKNIFANVDKLEDQAILNNKGIIHTKSEVSNKNGGLEGKFIPIEDNDHGQKLLSMIQYYEFLKNLWYEKVGRRFNINEKQERNINSEVQYSNLNFAILEKKHLAHLQIGAQQLRDKFGIDIKFDSPKIDNKSDIYEQNKFSNDFKKDKDNN